MTLTCSRVPDTRVRRLSTTLYCYLFLSDLVLLYPVYVLLFGDTGLTVGQISGLFVLWSVTAIVLEVPSGAWADTVSRRLLLCLAPLLTGACFALWVLAPSWWAFALGFVLWGAAGRARLRRPGGVGLHRTRPARRCRPVRPHRWVAPGPPGCSACSPRSVWPARSSPSGDTRRSARRACCPVCSPPPWPPGSRNTAPPCPPRCHPPARPRRRTPCPTGWGPGRAGGRACAPASPRRAPTGGYGRPCCSSRR